MRLFWFQKMYNVLKLMKNNFQIFATAYKFLCMVDFLYLKFLENWPKCHNKWSNYWVLLWFCSRPNQNSFLNILRSCPNQGYADLPSLKGGHLDIKDVQCAENKYGRKISYHHIKVGLCERLKIQFSGKVAKFAG